MSVEVLKEEFTRRAPGLRIADCETGPGEIVMKDGHTLDLHKNGLGWALIEGRHTVGGEPLRVIVPFAREYMRYPSEELAAVLAKSATDAYKAALAAA